MPTEEMLRSPAAQQDQHMLAGVMSMTMSQAATCSSRACDYKTAASHLVGQLGLLGVICSAVAHDIIALAADDLATQPCNNNGVCAGHEMICMVCHQALCERLECSYTALNRQCQAPGWEAASSGGCRTFREEAAHCLATLGGASHSRHVDQHLRGAAEGQATDLQHDQDGVVSRDPGTCATGAWTT